MKEFPRVCRHLCGKEGHDAAGGIGKRNDAHEKDRYPLSRQFRFSTQLAAVLGTDRIYEIERSIKTSTEGFRHEVEKFCDGANDTDEDRTYPTARPARDRVQDKETVIPEWHPLRRKTENREMMAETSKMAR
ncbi:hypothetical protein NEOLEDRAFT_1149569 [Neolentinus lepideus HHB14362 ss-1]|uniref:Uncharacterized protein n=1 Tax=Neolentinus lepideus HHB14362 ss-1 TaxID=1314782 RepID=A0A165QZV4_9AGAM|nr:hypothetical protein NEOLEDRAFT_1149569 [Neolentinus lepideus HHB14362 ss-1]